MSGERAIAAAAGAAVMAIAGHINSDVVFSIALIILCGVVSGVAAVRYASWEAKKIVKEAVQQHVDRLHAVVGESEAQGAPDRKPG